MVIVCTNSQALIFPAKKKKLTLKLKICIGVTEEEALVTPVLFVK